MLFYYLHMRFFFFFSIWGILADLNKQLILRESFYAFILRESEQAKWKNAKADNNTENKDVAKFWIQMN